MDENLFSGQPSLVWIPFLVVVSESLSCLSQLMMMSMSVSITSENETDYFSFLFSFVLFLSIDLKIFDSRSRCFKCCLLGKFVLLDVVQFSCKKLRREREWERKWEDVNQVEMKRVKKFKRVQPKPQGIHLVSRWSTLDLRRILSSWFCVPLFRVTVLSVILLVSRFDLWSAPDTSTSILS